MSRSPQPAISIELELRRKQDAEVEGPYDRILLQEMLYTGVIDEHAGVREAGEAAWREVSDEPDMVAILRMLGRAPTVGRPAVAGWVSKEAPSLAVSTPSPVPPLAERRGGSLLWWVVPVAMVVAAAVAWFW